MKSDKQEVVKEFIMQDGIGSQMWRKIYAMSYAKHYNLLFQDTPITDFFIHESDRINNEEDKIKVINQFTSIINNPWSDINFNNESTFLCDKVGAGLPQSQGIILETKDFTKCAPSFSNINEVSEDLVIHIRRGNVIKENPRWIDEEVYLNLIKSIPLVLDKLNISVNQICIITDAPDSNIKYKPISDNQKNKWAQPYLNTDENGQFPITTINFDLLKSANSNLKIYNKISPHEAFLKMIKAKILIVSRSSFSQAAGLLSKNKVIDMFNSHNQFMGSSGIVNPNGSITLY